MKRITYSTRRKVSVSIHSLLRPLQDNKNKQMANTSWKKEDDQARAKWKVSNGSN